MGQAQDTGREAGAADSVADFEVPEPDPAPITTIAWRMGHMAIGLFAMRASAHFGDGSVGYATTDWPLDAGGGLALLDGCLRVLDGRGQPARRAGDGRPVRAGRG